MKGEDAPYGTEELHSRKNWRRVCLSLCRSCPIRWIAFHCNGVASRRGWCRYQVALWDVLLYDHLVRPNSPTPCTWSPYCQRPLFRILSGIHRNPPPGIMQGSGDFFVVEKQQCMKHMLYTHCLLCQLTKNPSSCCLQHRWYDRWCAALITFVAIGISSAKQVLIA